MRAFCTTVSYLSRTSLFLWVTFDCSTTIHALRIHSILVFICTYILMRVYVCTYEFFKYILLPFVVLLNDISSASLHIQFLKTLSHQSHQPGRQVSLCNNIFFLALRVLRTYHIQHFAQSSSQCTVREPPHTYECMRLWRARRRFCHSVKMLIMFSFHCLGMSDLWKYFLKQ